MTADNWTITTGDGPILATAIHAGHQLRPEVEALMKLPEDVRLREEDPFTDEWVGVAENRIVVHQSRFEVDLNRPREKAIYVRPEDAWGLDIWQAEPGDDIVEESLAIYDRFYTELGELCDSIVEAHGHLVVLDIHSYNHRRRGPDAPVDDPELNPEVNLGTESIDPAWDPVVSAFGQMLGELPFDDEVLDVRTNVRFKGGHMPRWINARYGDRGCAIAIEMKKIFMDEWTGVLDESITAMIGHILESTTVAMREQLADR